MTKVAPVIILACLFAPWWNHSMFTLRVWYSSHSSRSTFLAKPRPPLLLSIRAVSTW